MSRFRVVQRQPLYLPWVDYQDAQTWNGPLAPGNFRTLIKLSDTVHWRHTGTNWLILNRSFSIMQKDSAPAAFQMSVGVVLAVTAGNCTVAYLEPMSMTQNSDDPSRITEERYWTDYPISLRPTAPAGGLFFGVDAASTVVETVINNGTTIANAAGVAATAPAVGDLLMKILKTSTGGLGVATCRIRQFIHYQAA